MNNKLIVIENGKINVYSLDDKLMWKLGRPTKDNQPDIRLYSTTVSRDHGIYQNMDGIWFYVDKNGKNGTVYNKKHIDAGINGRIKPIMLKDGDVFIFGGGEKEVISSKTIWAAFFTKGCDENWRISDTKGLEKIIFTDGIKSTIYEKPSKGTIVRHDNGTAIYMGDITYLSGDISVVGKD